MPRAVEAFLLFWLPRVDVAAHIRAKRDAARIAALEAEAIEIEARHAAACQRELAAMWESQETTCPQGKTQRPSTGQTFKGTEMNQIEQLNSHASAMLSDLRAGKIDAATAQAGASLVKTQFKGFDSEIAMARHGQMLKDMAPIWRKRIVDQVVSA